MYQIALVLGDGEAEGANLKWIDHTSRLLGSGNMVETMLGFYLQNSDFSHVAIPV